MCQYVGDGQLGMMKREKLKGKSENSRGLMLMNGLMNRLSAVQVSDTTGMP